ncbi:hypothetical protein ACSBR2_011712 [Camellia fascicularis]
MDVLAGLVNRLKDISQGLDAFLDDESKIKIDILQDNLKGILLNMFLGGVDTTSIILEWAMTQLMKNPTKLKKAEEE